MNTRNENNSHMDYTGVQEEMLRNQIVGLLPSIRGFARSLARDLDKADDLVQAACERALDRLDQVHEGTRLDSWLFRITFTQWINKLRRLKTRTASLVLLSNENKTSVWNSNRVPHINMAIDLQTALRTLTEKHYAVLMLVCVEGYSYAEAADVMDVPTGTVASRVARARSMLRKILSRVKP